MIPPEYQDCYQQLLADIDAHQGSGRPETEIVEKCFKSGLDHWAKVYKRVSRQGFASKREEIVFFKEVKPGFTAWIEYYTYRYHVLLFRPSSSTPDIERFWEWEQRKMERFYENNREFCRYIREGATDRDSDYFLRSPCPPCNARASACLMYDLESEMSSPMDHLVTMIKAYELYEKYIQLINQTCHLEA